MALTHSQLTWAFRLFDPDGKGAVDSSAACLVLRGTGFDHLSKEEMHSMTRAMDFECCGVVTLAQFLRVVQRKSSEQGSPEEILKAFSLISTSGQGKLLEEELVDCCSNDLTVSISAAKRAFQQCGCKTGIPYEIWKNNHLAFALQRR